MDDLEKKIKDLEAKIADVKKRFPYHSEQQKANVFFKLNIW